MWMSSRRRTVRASIYGLVPSVGGHHVVRLRKRRTQVVHVLYIVGHIVSMHVNVPRAGVHLCGTLHCTRLHMHEPSNKAAISECNPYEQTSTEFHESSIEIK